MFAVRISLGAVAAFLSVGCPSPQRAAVETPEPVAAAAADADADADVPELPPPSCETAVGEFVFGIVLHNSGEARDSLVGECIDHGWSMSERRCVADASSTTRLAECVKTSTRMVVADGDGDGDVGIAACDRAIETYRRCIESAMSQTLSADTEEALAITVAAWRRLVADGGDAGWRQVQRECGAFANKVPRTIRRYGCHRGR